jgi:hypothetical protein
MHKADSLPPPFLFQEKSMIEKHWLALDLRIFSFSFFFCSLSLSPTSCYFAASILRKSMISLVTLYQRPLMRILSASPPPCFMIPGTDRSIVHYIQTHFARSIDSSLCSSSRRHCDSHRRLTNRIIFVKRCPIDEDFMPLFRSPRRLMTGAQLARVIMPWLWFGPNALVGFKSTCLLELARPFLPKITGSIRSP